MKRILILGNNQGGLYHFRKEILEELVRRRCQVFVSVPKDEFTEDVESIGVRVINNPFLDRRGTNPIHDLRLLQYYRFLIKKTNPDMVLTYTIKPNVYGGYLCGKMHVPYIANVTGLGTSIQGNNAIQRLSILLYRIGLKKAQIVFFQNKDNLKYMTRYSVIKRQRVEVLPGSGVNTELHCYEPYPSSDPIVFSVIGRIMKDKGIDEVLSAAEIIKKRHKNVEFRLIGEFDEKYEDKVNYFVKKGIIRYFGIKKDIHPYLKESHAVIHASYHEGMSNVLLEAASTGRPVIATNVPGCIETFEPGYTGISFVPGSVGKLVNAIDKFLSLSNDKREMMGKAGREKVVREFDRRIVVEKYMKEIFKKRG